MTGSVHPPHRALSWLPIIGFSCVSRPPGGLDRRRALGPSARHTTSLASMVPSTLACT
jgi:hypothetical protein